jgi:hypothetical protein
MAGDSSGHRWRATNGRTLFVQDPGITFAIWGPWEPRQSWIRFFPDRGHSYSW